VPRFIPQSPRKRRRVKWIGLAVVAVAVAVGLVLAIPSPKKENPNPTGAEGPAQTVSQATVKLTSADREQIDALLAKFVPAAVGRKSAALAWSLAGPELKASSTLDQWKKGVSPVPAYPVRERSFTGLPTMDVEKDQVTLSLLVHPKAKQKNLGDYTFAIQTIKSHGRWLVNRLYTIAINHPVRGGQHEIGPADFSAPSGAASPSQSKPRLGSSWLLPIVGILSVALLTPLAIGGFVVVRGRRRRSKTTPEEMPRLPTGYR